MTGEYNPKQAMLEHAKILTCEDGVIISQAMGDQLLSLDVPTRNISDVIFPVVSLKKQERILKHGSLRMKVALRRARLHNAEIPDADKLHEFQLKGELRMLRLGMPKKERHPKIKLHSDIHLATYVNAEGVKKDIRELDYLSLLNNINQG